MAHTATVRVTRPSDADLAGYLATWIVNGATVLADQPVSLWGIDPQDISYQSGVGSPPTPVLQDGDTVQAIIKAVDTGGNRSTGVATPVTTVPSQPPGDPAVVSFTVT